MTNAHLYFKGWMYILPHEWQAILPHHWTCRTLQDQSLARMGLLMTRPLLFCQCVHFWMHCVPIKQSQSSSYLSSTCSHPIIITSALQTALGQSSHWFTPLEWTWLIDGHGWPWTYKGGNSHSLLQNHRCSQSGQTFPSSCVQMIWTPWFPDIWQRPTVCIHLCQRTGTATPPQYQALHHILLCKSTDLQWRAKILLTLREVLTKRHCVLKEVSRLRTRSKEAKTQSDRLWIARLTLLLHRTRIEKEYRLDKYLSTMDYLHGRS